MAQAFFAAGCFWGIQAAFDKHSGVTETVVGYSGGQSREPTYREVCSGRTGHAETVCVTFDPERISYQELLGIFWNIHDPTQRNRQGPDIGTQYRSAIFYTDTGQHEEALLSRDAQAMRSKQPIVTEITKAGIFWRAEDYHQNYLARKRGETGVR